MKMGFEEPEHIREFVASNEMQVFQMIIVIVEKSIAQNRVFGYFFLQRASASQFTTWSLSTFTHTNEKIEPRSGYPRDNAN